MTPPSDNTPAARRVQLPSGKTIDVVYFSDPDGRRPAPAPVPPLMECGCCGSALMQPVSWDEAEQGHWALTLRCPECWWLRDGVFGPEAVERFDIALDQGLQTLVTDLKQLMRANMEEELERFVLALHSGQIWPMDF